MTAPVLSPCPFKAPPGRFSVFRSHDDGRWCQGYGWTYDLLPEAHAAAELLNRTVPAKSRYYVFNDAGELLIDTEEAV